MKNDWYKSKYPAYCLVGDEYYSNRCERHLLKIHLEKSIVSGLVDPEIIPFLERLNFPEKITTVFSCWGHPEYGNLLFRNSANTEGLIKNVLFPLINKYRYSHPYFESGIHNWYDLNGAPKLGYAIVGFPEKTDEKIEFMEYFCELVEKF